MASRKIASAPLDCRIKQVRLSRAGEALPSTIQAHAGRPNRRMLQDDDKDQIGMVEDVLHGLELRLIKMNREGRGDPVPCSIDEDRPE